MMQERYVDAINVVEATTSGGAWYSYRRFCRIGLFGLFLFGLSACDGEPENPRAGQVVKPLWGGPGGTPTSSERVRVSLYEYYDFQKFLITGQSISFEIPKYFTTSTDNQEGGPQALINVAFDPIGQKPYILSSYLDRSGFERARPRILRIMISSSAIQLIGHDEDDVTEQGRYPLMPGLMTAQRLAKLDSEYCGLKAYAPATPSVGNSPDIPDRGSRDPKWPFRQTVVLGQWKSTDRSGLAITCTGHVESDGFPYCGLNGIYRGWPVNIHFSGAEVCRAKEVLASAFKFLDQFRVRETQRSAGQVEHRYREAS